MYEVKSSHRLISSKEVETWIAEITSANILEVEVGTNGLQGGDTGHGCRTYFSIKDLGSTDISASLIKDKSGDTEGFAVELGGDCELETFIEALKFAVKVLEEQKDR